MKKLLLAAGLALVVAAPAAAARIDTSHTIRASGTVLSDKTTGSTARFTINLQRGPGHKLMYMDRTMGVSLRAQTITFVDYTNANQAEKSGWAVKIKGMGWSGGKLVPFTAIAIDHPATLGTDIFRISWNHGASFGGKLQFGGIKILQL